MVSDDREVSISLEELIKVFTAPYDAHSFAFCFSYSGFQHPIRSSSRRRLHDRLELVCCLNLMDWHQLLSLLFCLHLSVQHIHLPPLHVLISCPYPVDVFLSEAPQGFTVHEKIFN